MSTIGILDIYGFENFRQNSFEQLCINTANEQLQTFFNRNVFHSELEAYAVEGIKSVDIHITDNESLIKLLLDPVGVYAIIDEESKFPKATDLTLIEKMTKTFTRQSEFQRVKNQNLQFVIHHFAGPVTYNVYGFLEKNRDTLSQNLFDVMKQSESTFVSDLFTAALRNTGSFKTSTGAVRRRAGRKSVILDRPLNLKPSESKTKKLELQFHKKSTKQKSSTPEPSTPTAKTLAGYFRNSLKELIGKMSSANPHFVRCIKPNTSKSSDMFDDELVGKQLKYTGVLETVNIRRQGFAFRLPFETFIHRYKFISFPLMSEVESGPNNCMRIISSAGIVGCEIGKTRVFLRYYHADELSASLQTSIQLVVTCQAYVRGLIARRQYQNKVTQVNCSTLQQLVSGVSSELADIQRRHCDEDRTRHTAQKEYAEVKRPKATLEMPEVQMRKSPTPVQMRRSPNAVQRRTPAQFRNSPTPMPRTNSPRPAEQKVEHDQDNDSLEELLAATVDRMPALANDIWCKLHYFEKGRMTAKFYTSDWNLMVNSSPAKYNGYVIGLLNEDIAHDEDTEVMRVLNKIGKGVKIDRDSHGNIYLTRLSDCNIFVKGFNHPHNHCIADEVVCTSGRIGLEKTKIFDIMKFMSLVADEFRSMPIDVTRIEQLSMINFSFLYDTESQYDTPCWMNIINLCALDLLSNKTALTDIIGMAGAQLSVEQTDKILSMWRNKHKRRSSVPNCSSRNTAL